MRATSAVWKEGRLVPYGWMHVYKTVLRSAVPDSLQKTSQVVYKE
jgi:uncharacterized protein YbdZ (MbtH family)